MEGTGGADDGNGNGNDEVEVEVVEHATDMAVPNRETQLFEGVY